jgi:phage terminase small subunit
VKKSRSRLSPPGGVKTPGGTRRKTPVVSPVDTEPSPVQSRFSPPAHLRPDTAAWWQAVAKDYALESHHLRILTLAAEAWDRGVEARESIAKHGTVYVDRFDQPRARPEVAIERDSRIAFARLVRELALDLDPPDEAGRPPRLGSMTSKAAPGIDWDAEDRRILGLD